MKVRQALRSLGSGRGRRIRNYRTNRGRAVFAYRAPCPPEDGSGDETPGDTADVAGSAAVARLARLRTHAPFNPVGGTMVRPVADATNTLNILREILRSPR